VNDVEILIFEVETVPDSSYVPPAIGCSIGYE